MQSFLIWPVVSSLFLLFFFNFNLIDKELCKISSSTLTNSYPHSGLPVLSFLSYAVFSIFLFLSTPVNHMSRIISYPDRFSSRLFSSCGLPSSFLSLLVLLSLVLSQSFSSSLSSFGFFYYVLFGFFFFFRFYIFSVLMHDTIGAAGVDKLAQTHCVVPTKSLKDD